jgi:hypothetical protein
VLCLNVWSGLCIVAVDAVVVSVTYTLRFGRNVCSDIKLQHECR